MKKHTYNMSLSHAECDRQDITRAGIIQDVGVVAIMDTRGILLAISNNHARCGWVNREVRTEELGTVHVDEIFHEDIAGMVQQGIQSVGNSKFPKTRTFMFDIFYHHKTYATFLSQPNGNLVLEIEDFDRQQIATRSILDTSNVISRLSSNASQEGAVNDLCAAVFESSSYDRAMTYKFLDDLSGEVIYEINRGGKASGSFLGLRFPAGDIPLPARKAYATNPVRFIADIEAPSCELLQLNEDISLSRSFLRGCVLPHKSYLRSMGVRSSLSIAITAADGELWGLVALHSYSEPIVPTIEDRVSYAILSSVTSTLVQHHQRTEQTATETKITNLLTQIDVKKSLAMFVVQNKTELMELLGVNSISLFAPDGVSTAVGATGVSLNDLPITNQALVYGSLANPLQSYACLSVLGYKLVLTRMSDYQPTFWAGNPNELHASEATPGIAMPRKSFERYMDHHSNNPPPFTKKDECVLRKMGDLLESAIHQIRVESAEAMIVKATKERDLVEMKSGENYAFFANMSHELRTPLHAISGVFDIMQELGDDEQVKKYSKVGLDTCRDMMKTLDCILSIVRKTHEKNKIEFTLIMVKEIFESTSNGLKMFATKNDVIFDVALECNPETLVRVDVPKIIQVFNNLCGNAIKFSSSTGADIGRVGRVETQVSILDSESVKSVWAAASEEYARYHHATQKTIEHDVTTMTCCKWLVVQTQDNGCGIHQSDLSKIFTVFSQVGDVATKRFAGTGLGLHICLLNINDMNGCLSVASTPGKGSLFFYCLPVEDEKSRTLVQSEKGRLGLGLADAPDPTNGWGNEEVVFVVVDDSKVNVMVAKKQIEGAFAKAKIYTAANGKIGLELIERLEKDGPVIDGVLMDYHMPLMSGIEATRLLRKAKRLTPITILTADITEISRQAMLASGTDFILIKPSRTREVIKMCVQMIELKKSR